MTNEEWPEGLPPHEYAPSVRGDFCAEPRCHLPRSHPVHDDRYKLAAPRYEYRLITLPPGMDHSIRSPTHEITVTSENGHDATAQILVREVAGGRLDIRVLGVRRTTVLVVPETPTETDLEP